MEGWVAFRLFKKLTWTLREWGYDIRDDGEYGEFSLGGFVCSYRFFDVLDIDFLRPGESLQSRSEPELVFIWEDGWCCIPEDEEFVGPVSSLEVFNYCMRRINLMAAAACGLAPDICLIANDVLPDATSSP